MAQEIRDARSSVRVAFVTASLGILVKVWNGTAFIAEPVKLWSGTAYVDPLAVKTWNGTAFV